MDVINLSLGEPEIEPSRDIVVKAIDGAARAGVVPCIAAGNDGDDVGKGSVGSPGSAPLAITAAASTTGAARRRHHRGFSSIGPTPYSLQLKPDVTAPGVNVALLRARTRGSGPRSAARAWPRRTSPAPPRCSSSSIPTWTVAQIKSALMLTGDPAYTNDARTSRRRRCARAAAASTFARANAPLVFAAPSSALVRPAEAGREQDDLDRALRRRRRRGHLDGRRRARRARAVTVPASVTVPGHARRRRRTSRRRGARATAPASSCSPRGTDVRRIPYWLHVERPRLGKPAQDADEDRDVQRQHPEGQGDASSSTAIPEGVDATLARRPGAGLRACASTQAGRELRRPRRVAGAASGDAAGRAQRRREPAHRLRRPARRPQSVPRDVRRARRRSPARSCRAPAPTTSSSTRRAAARRQVHVPVLDQRRRLRPRVKLRGYSQRRR